jgi:hypothetical protein
LSVHESLYTHEGTAGHEIVFAFAASFNNPQDYERDGFAFVDQGMSNEVEWIELHRFRTGSDRLFPQDLLKDIDRRASSR